MAIDKNAISTLFGADVLTNDDHRLGDVGQVYLDDESGSPEWVTVRTGLFGTKETFVPIRNADLDERGLRVPFDKQLVSDAPRVDADQDHLSPEEEQELYRHYGLTQAGGDANDDRTRTGETTTGTMTGDVDERPAGLVGGVDERSAGVTGDRYSDTNTDTAGTVGHDTSGPTTDEAMTRSEERLRVGTENVETGRVRLRKHVVTEQQTVQVPVTREEVTLEREPITDANRGAAEAGPELSDEEHEVILHEERPVIEKEVVPVERVRVGKETVEETTTVSDQVRKEEIETDTDGSIDGNVDGKVDGNR
ncbi:DUF2382 domain-containing protein [Tersicoccus sp. Bi-70]|uniref:DUF2382 domain-containing protein n=1 Tax=Tersicoccus sp. Bi-70 TaxID=1897634 RepID=UPI000976C0D2|nr:PRC and DUF2382 domain-containing protein [Tersicoccus sp. Bi-70]OMH35051.1 photosystem reaction center subunit H [Tersicoccus sp. Bi-70]